MRAFAAILILLAAAAPAAAQIPSDDDPRLRLTVRAGDRWQRPTTGDFCLRTTGGRGCADTSWDVADLPRIRVGPREALELRPAAAASRVRVSWGRIAYDEEGRVEAVRADTAGRRWRVRLPRRARNARYLRVHAEYGERFEWTDFLVGVRIA